uniref:Protein kinase domain-containing protein n=2 Tax=Davidia involucrata TaxID=16924 RepID=A0A5B7B6U6_DAVIN
MRKNSKGVGGVKRTLVIIIVSVALGALLFFCSYYFWRKHAKRKGLREKQRYREMLLLDSVTDLSNKDSPNENNHGKSSNTELKFYDLDTIVDATDNFSPDNKLGQGGFGPVYKGQLSNGQEIAVKRLTKNSGQGITEFKNEVFLIARLQHRNLVRLLGCCIENEEKILVYEYMPNKSLHGLFYLRYDHQSLHVIAGVLIFLHLIAYMLILIYVMKYNYKSIRSN